MRVDLPVVKELNGEETLRHGEGVILPPPKLPPPRTTAFALPCDDGDQQYMLSNSFTELRGGGDSLWVRAVRAVVATSPIGVRRGSLANTCVTSGKSSKRRNRNRVGRDMTSIRIIWTA